MIPLVSWVHIFADLSEIWMILESIFRPPRQSHSPLKPAVHQGVWVMGSIILTLSTIVRLVSKSGVIVPMFVLAHLLLVAVGKV